MISFSLSSWNFGRVVISESGSQSHGALISVSPPRSCDCFCDSPTPQKPFQQWLEFYNIIFVTVMDRPSSFLQGLQLSAAHHTLIWSLTPSTRLTYALSPPPPPPPLPSPLPQEKIKILINFLLMVIFESDAYIFLMVHIMQFLWRQRGCSWNPC